MSPVVRLLSVGKSFWRSGDEVVVLDRLDLEVGTGEVVIIRGRSGSGKTTLLNLLAGWQTPDRGWLDWGIDRPGAWERVAVVPQSLGLLPELTLGENIGFPGRMAGHPKDGRALAHALQIEHLLDRPAARASLGEQQRAAVARALVRAPALVLADEPSSHQDSARLHLVWQALTEAATSGTAVIASTHDPEAFPYADRVLDLRHGRLV